MKAHLVSLMVWAEDDMEDWEIALHAKYGIGECSSRYDHDRIFSKSITIAPDQVAMKAHVIFGERIDE